MKDTEVALTDIHVEDTKADRLTLDKEDLAYLGTWRDRYGRYQQNQNAIYMGECGWVSAEGVAGRAWDEE